MAQINIDEFKPNSNKSKMQASPPAKEPEKKVEKVVTGMVKTKPKSKMAKFADIFIAEDVSNVKEYIVNDVLIPAVKKAIDDIVSEGIHMLLYKGDPRAGRRGGGASRISYDRCSYDQRRDPRDNPSNYNTRKSAYDYDRVIIPTRAEAEQVLSRMDELIDVYNVVSIADFYDLVGITPEFTDNKYGWRDIRSADIFRERDGYRIRLPKASPID